MFKFIKIQDFQNQTSLDPVVLYSYKVFPRMQSMSYMRDQFYIYCYLDPTINYIDNNKLFVVTTDIKTFYFAYEPFYIGKASTRNGYRLNQHLNDFIKGRKGSNPEKIKKFQKIDKNLRKLNMTWGDYKNNYIIPLISFNDEKTLANFEIELIHTIGTVYESSNKGPLINKITDYNYKRKFNKKDEF